nr:hypothetical protein HK105_001536 [Polyrhizophydium stewartii]
MAFPLETTVTESTATSSPSSESQTEPSPTLLDDAPTSPPPLEPDSTGVSGRQSFSSPSQTFQDTFSPTPTATSTPLNSTAPEAGLSSSAKAAVITMSVFVAVAVVGIYLFRKVTLRPSGRFKARIRSTASSHDEETASRSGSTSRAAEDFALHRVAPSPMPGSVRPPVVAMTSAPGMPAVAAPRVEMYQWPAQQYDTSSVAGSAVGYPHAYDYTPEHGSLDGRYAKRPL